MFKSEYDKIGDKVAINTANIVITNPVNSVNQVTIDTDATAGLITVSTKARLGKALEPAFELDGATPLVIDLATGRRTFLLAASLKEIVTTAAGMNGTGYGLNSSGGDQ
jgi:hypothetical protein